MKIILKMFQSLMLFLISVCVSGIDNIVKPITPNASPEAIALLNFFYSTSV